MASSLKKKVSTPARLPWIPPGKQKKETFNTYAHKKNSKQQLPEFGKSNAADAFKDKEFLEASRKREEDRLRLEGDIKRSVIEEEEEEGEEEDDKRSKSAEKGRIEDKNDEKKRSKSAEDGDRARRERRRESRRRSEKNR